MMNVLEKCDLRKLSQEDIEIGVQSLSLKKWNQLLIVYPLVLP